MSQYSFVTISELESKCLSHMAENGIPFEGPLIFDGNLHRFSRDRTKNQTDEFYRFDKWEFNGKLYARCYYGTWSGGLKEYFYNSYENDPTLSKEEWIQIKKEEERRQKEYVEQQRKEKIERFKNAQKYWNEASARAIAINNLGDVVGNMRFQVSNPRENAFIFTDGSVHDLLSLVIDNDDWSSLEHAADINDMGQIVGYGYRYGKLTAFALTPYH